MFRLMEENFFTCHMATYYEVCG